MARGIRLYDVVEDDLLYPITVTELVYDNVKEKTLKDILDHIFESPTITTPIINGGIIEEANIEGGTIKALITGSTIDNCNIENSNFHDGEIGDSIIKNVELDGTIQGGIIQGSRINDPEIYGGNSYNLDITSSKIHVPEIDGGEINKGTINNASIYASTSYNQILYTPKIYGGNFGGKNEEGEQVDLNLVNPTISGGTINADSISIKGESGFIKADGTIDDNAYVTIDTVQTISGLKKFSGANYFMNGLRISEPDLNEAYSFQRSSTSGNLTLNHFTGSNMKYLGEIDTAGNLTAYSFIKKNGKSSEFLKADGSVDSNTYLTSHQSLADYAKKSEIPTKTSQLTNDSGYISSANDILTKLKTVDGSGSGLDADLLDGKQPSELSVAVSDKTNRLGYTYYNDTFDANTVLGNNGGKVYVGSGGSVWSNIPSTTGNAHAKTILNIPVSTSTAQLFFNSTGNVHYRVGNSNSTNKNWKEFAFTESSSTITASGFKVNGKTGFLKADGNVDSNEYVKGTSGTLINPTIKEASNSIKSIYFDNGDIYIEDPQINNGVIDSSTINDASLMGQIDLVDGCNMVGGEIQTNKISIKDGKSSQFLKADGSVDDSNYQLSNEIIDLGTVTTEDLKNNIQLEDGTYQKFENAYNNNLNIIIRFKTGTSEIKCIPQYTSHYRSNTYMFEIYFYGVYYMYALTSTNKLTYRAT